jgi:PilZ domain
MKEQDYAVRRTEDRVGMKVTALLVGGRQKLGVETGLTENVSSRGARVISTSEWSRNDTILVAVPGFHFTSAARVAYCDALGDGRFSTGLEFVPAGPHLEITALAASLEFPRRSQQASWQFDARARRLA